MDRQKKEARIRDLLKDGMKQRAPDERIKQTAIGDGNIIQAGNDVHIQHYRQPPPDHPNATTCPQCDERTWIATERCVVCGADVQELRRLTELRNEAMRLKRRRSTFIGSASLAAVGLVLLPDSLGTALFLTTLVLLLVAGSFHLSIPAIEDRRK